MNSIKAEHCSQMSDQVDEQPQQQQRPQQQHQQTQNHCQASGNTDVREQECDIERWERERNRQYRMRYHLQRDFEHRMTKCGRYHAKQPVGRGINTTPNWRR